MTKTLDVLVKVATYKVEQAQQALAEAQRAIAEAEAEVLRWRQEAARGVDLAAGESDGVLLQQSGAFMLRARRAEERAAGRVHELNQVADTLRARLAEAFATQKRYEILQKRQEVARLKRRAAKQQAQLEEAFTVGGGR